MIKYPITVQYKKELKDRLIHLKEKKLKKINDDIKYFRSFCNFSEDTPFDEALDEQAKVKKEISNIENTLSQTEVNHSISKQIVLGSTVTFQELPEGNPETYTLVIPDESDPINQKISIESPIGKSLIGHSEKEIVHLKTPSDYLKIKIVSISAI